MAEVGIHVQDQLVVVLHGVTHGGEQGGPEAELAGAMQDVQA
jgi:hypothetical protein